VESLHCLPSYISTNQNYLTVLTISLKSNTNVFTLPPQNVEHSALANRDDHYIAKSDALTLTFDTIWIYTMTKKSLKIP
jgi:hypothetical protein